MGIELLIARDVFSKKKKSRSLAINLSRWSVMYGMHDRLPIILPQFKGMANDILRWGSRNARVCVAE